MKRQPRIYKDELLIAVNAFNKGFDIPIYAISEGTKARSYFCLFVQTEEGLKPIATNISSNAIGMSRLLDAIDSAFSSEYSGSFTSYLHINSKLLNQYFY